MNADFTPSAYGDIPVSEDDVIAPVRGGSVGRADLAFPDERETWLARLDGVLPQTSGGYIAFCPAHPDGVKYGNRSLSVRFDGGTILARCFAGCSFTKIKAAIKVKSAGGGAPVTYSSGARRLGGPPPQAPTADLRTLLSRVDPDEVWQTALAYASLGWSVIPLRVGMKVPRVRWRPLMNHAADRNTVADWFSRWPFSNVGIVCGKVSGIVVLDLDSVEGVENVQRISGGVGIEAATVSSGKGMHLYFAAPPEPVPTRVGLLPGVDLKGEKGFVVAPPSVHATGARYAWTLQRPLTPCPDWLRRAAAC